MSSLQVGLAVAGGLILGGVIAYNTWNARRNEPRQADPEPDAPRDAVAPQDRADARIEPSLHSTQPASLVAEPELDPDFEARLRPNFATTSTLALSTVPDRAPGLDALIDVIVPIHLYGTQVSGDAVLAALPATRRVGSKPLAVEGREEVFDPWEHPVPGVRYNYLQAGVQLANRMGALNEIEFSEFVMKAQGFADAINAAPDFPDMLQEVARARELDQFASDHDAQLMFMLRARQAAWSPGYVQQNAARLGLVPGAMPGRLVLPASAPGLPPVLTLGYDTQAALAEDPDQSAIRDITLSLDVAQVHRSEQPFARLREVAAALCEAMDGVLCDQNGTPLPAMAMDPIAADLELLYDQLDARDLSAGSVLARRLFS